MPEYAAGLGLGIALSRPEVPIVVIDGDASLLMELGSLATVGNNQPHRYLHFVVKNGVQFNGVTNMPIAVAEAGIDFAAMAAAAGYQHVARFNQFDELQAALPALLAAKGPTFVELTVQAESRKVGPQQPQPILPDIQFVRMRMASRKLMKELESA